ncbi:hypothetical protein D3C78_1464320 [compost metagenome]
MPPGAVALTRTPRSAVSNARHAVSALTPPLAAPYGTRLMLRVAIEETLTMAPLPCSSMNGSAAWQHHSVGNSERRTSASICCAS